MKKMVKYFEYKDGIKTSGKGLRLYFINGEIQNRSNFDKLMEVTASKLDYRMEGVRYSGGTYPNYVNNAFPEQKKVKEEIVRRQPLSIQDILDICRESKAAEKLDENGEVKVSKRGRKSVDNEELRLLADELVSSMMPLSKFLKEKQLTKKYAAMNVYLKKNKIEVVKGRKGRQSKDNSNLDSVIDGLIASKMTLMDYLKKENKPALYSRIYQTLKQRNLFDALPKSKRGEGLKKYREGKKVAA